MEKFRLLTESEIECKVKKVTDKGAIILLYKTARTDMDILDETVGAENWECSYDEIKGNLYCTITIRCVRNYDDGHQFVELVSKQDCGIESREDGDGNEKKGEASDAFKRAGFKWGIGRELYSAPFIWIPAEKMNIKGGDGKWKTLDHFSVEKIAYDSNRRISGLAIRNDTTGKRCFVWQAQS